MMNAWLKYVGMGCIALTALACGAKGNDDEDDGDETGGKSGSGGGGGTGGSSTGGTGGTAGSGGPLPVMTTMAFADDSEVCPIPTATNLAGCWRLVDSNADMTTSMPIPADQITFRRTEDDGDPDAGAFEATIPYTMASQWVSFGINFDSKDLTNRVISARVKIASGLGDPADLMTAPAGTKIYAKSGMGYCYANGDYFNQGDMTSPAGEWHTIQFNLLRPPLYADPNCAAPFDPADVREIGVQFDTSMTSTTAQEAVVRIDTVTF